MVECLSVDPVVVRSPSALGCWREQSFVVAVFIILSKVDDCDCSFPLLVGRWWSVAVQVDELFLAFFYFLLKGLVAAFAAGQWRVVEAHTCVAASDPARLVGQLMLLSERESEEAPILGRTYRVRVTRNESRVVVSGE